MTNEEIINAVEKQERLQEFVYCLYRDEKYTLKKIRSMDAKNREIAMTILDAVYPTNIFGDLERLK